MIYVNLNSTPTYLITLLLKKGAYPFLCFSCGCGPFDQMLRTRDLHNAAVQPLVMRLVGKEYILMRNKNFLFATTSHLSQREIS